MTASDSIDEPRAESPRANQPYRIWAATAPFRKDGLPVFGTMGSSMQRVVVMTVETFQRLLREHPEWAKAITIELGDLDA